MYRVTDFRQRIYHSQHVLWIFSGFLTGVSLLVPSLWILAFVGILLQLYLLHQRTPAIRQVFVGATFAGTTHMLLSLSWGWSVVPLQWIGVSSAFVQGLLIFSVWIFSAFIMGLGYGVALAVLHYLTQKHWSLFILFPGALLVGELLGRLLFSVGAISVDIGLNVSFGFGHVGYVLVEHTLLRTFAVWGGVYLLTFMVGVLVVCIYVFTLYITKKQTSRYLVMAVGVILLYVSSGISVPFQEQKQVPKDVALLSTKFSMKLDNSSDGTRIINALHKDAVEEALSEGNTTVILPEDARFIDSLDPDELVALTDIADVEVLLIDSTKLQRDGKTVLSTILYESTTKKRYTYDKQHLVPFGEQLPIIYSVVMRIVGMEDVVSYLQNNFQYRVGITKQEADVPDYLPAVLFCYESLVPYMTKSLVNKKTPFVAHVVSQAWFDDSSNVLKNQLSAMLRVQALWNNTYILQSSNMAPATVYTASGEVYYAPGIVGDGLYRVDSAEDIVAGGRVRL